MDFDADHLSCAVFWKWCRQQRAHIKGLAPSECLLRCCFCREFLQKLKKLTTAQTASDKVAGNYSCQTVRSLGDKDKR